MEVSWQTSGVRLGAHLLRLPEAIVNQEAGRSTLSTAQVLVHIRVSGLGIRQGIEI